MMSYQVRHFLVSTSVIGGSSEARQSGLINKNGQGYCNMSVVPGDQHLLSFQWKDHTQLYSYKTAIWSSVSSVHFSSKSCRYITQKMVSCEEFITYIIFLPLAHHSHINVITMFTLCIQSAVQVSQSNPVSWKALPPPQCSQASRLVQFSSKGWLHQTRH